VSDLPLELGPELSDRLARSLDVEGKIPRAFAALGPVEARDVVLIDGDDGIRARQLRDLGARVLAADGPWGRGGLPAASADVVVSCWSPFRDARVDDLAEAERILRPGGRLLVLHDYGRDDVSRLRPADLPEYTTWSRRDGWFLRTGFKVRVLHCWWTFDSADDVLAFLGSAFGDAGREFAGRLKRPRLSYNVAIYHRDQGLPISA
jgi:hypothetical protein